MDLYAVLAELVAERKKIDQLISALEALQDGRDNGSGLVHRPGRRGRKHMGAEERQEVSRRMQRYWQARKQAVSQQHDHRSRDSSERQPT
jgi:hypothetical protein